GWSHRILGKQNRKDSHLPPLRAGFKRPVLLEKQTRKIATHLEASTERVLLDCQNQGDYPETVSPSRCHSLVNRFPRSRKDCPWMWNTKGHDSLSWRPRHSQ